MMSQQTGVESKVIHSVQEIAWFAEVVRESRETMDAIPDESLPSWYREHPSEGVANRS